MTIMDMLGQSGVLTLLGMGIVFGFLVILVISIYTLGKLIFVPGKHKGDPVLTDVQKSVGNNAQTAAAISAAVNEYRKK